MGERTAKTVWVVINSETFSTSAFSIGTFPIDLNQEIYVNIAQKFTLQQFLVVPLDGGWCCVVFRSVFASVRVWGWGRGVVHRKTNSQENLSEC